MEYGRLRHAGPRENRPQVRVYFVLGRWAEHEGLLDGGGGGGSGSGMCMCVCVCVCVRVCVCV
jgi:hypothetical protein